MTARSYWTKQYKTHFSWNGNANNVFIITSLDWSKKIKLNKIEYNLFEIVMNLPFGTHEYKFIVDDIYSYDDNKPIIKNSYGNFNNIIFVFTDHNEFCVSAIKNKKNIETYQEFIDYAFEKSHQHIIEQFKIHLKNEKIIKCFKKNYFKKGLNNDKDFLREFLTNFIHERNYEEYIIENILNNCEIYLNHEELTKLMKNSVSYTDKPTCVKESKIILGRLCVVKHCSPYEEWMCEQGLEDNQRYCDYVKNKNNMNLSFRSQDFKGILSPYGTLDYLYYNKNNVIIKEEDLLLKEYNFVNFIIYSKNFIEKLLNKIDDKTISSCCGILFDNK